MPLTRENVLDPEQGKKIRRRLFLYANAWALCLGFLALLTSISYFIDPSSLISGGGSLAKTLKGWSYVWNALYLLGGLGIVIGLLARNRAIDMAGLTFMAGALIINALCVVFIQGGPGASTVPSLLAFAVAALARVRYLYVIGKL